MLSFHSLSLKIEKHLLFQNFSITFLPSSVIFITGKNGAGKSSLLKTIAGIQFPSKGSLTYGKDNIPISKIAQPYCTYIPHSLGIKLEFTVKETIMFWTQIYDVSKKHIDYLISSFNLDYILSCTVSKLSQGNIKKLVLLRLSLCNTPIYLLDEIEVNLDLENLKLLTNIIESKIEQKALVILATNNTPFIKNYQEIHICKDLQKIHIKE